MKTSTSRAARFARTEHGIVTIALGTVALHVADDNFFQPEPGTSPFDHLASGLIPVGLIAAAAALYPRLRAGLRAALALTFGVLGIAFGIPRRLAGLSPNGPPSVVAANVMRSPCA